MSDEPKKPTLKERLDATLQRKRAEAQARLDADCLARAEQVRTLLGMTGQCRMVRHTCTQCGHEDMVLDPRPTAPDDDYETRL